MESVLLTLAMATLIRLMRMVPVGHALNILDHLKTSYLAIKSSVMKLKFLVKMASVKSVHSIQISS
jgi:hypothetical protein